MRRNTQMYHFKNPLERIPHSPNEKAPESIHIPQKTERKKVPMPTCFWELVPFISKRVKVIAKSKKEVIPKLLKAMK